MTPNYADLAAELAKPEYVGLTDVQAVAVLTAQTATRSGPRIMSAADLLPLLSPASFVAAFDHPRFSEFKATLDAQSHLGVAEWATAFAARGLITVSERDAVISYATQPVITPYSPADLIGWSGVTEQDVAHARGM